MKLKSKHIVYMGLYLSILYIFLHLFHAFEISKGLELQGVGILEYSFSKFAENIENNPLEPFLTLFVRGSATLMGFILGNALALIIFLIIYDGRNLRHGIEHGSAVFSSESRFKKIRDKNPFENIILTKSVHLSLNHRNTGINLNVLLSGGPGSGKTRFFVKPNLMQMKSSYIVTDPKGEVLASTGKMLKSAGYRIKVLNLVDMSKSDLYNPFRYLRKGRDEDVLTLINSIIKNTEADSKKTGGDPFWEKAETLFLQAIFFYILYEEEEERQNMGTVIEMLRIANFSDENNELDKMFIDLEERDPDHIAVTQYKMFKSSAKETLRSIVITANARFSPFAIQAVSNLFTRDTFELDKLDDEKTAIFIIVSPSNTTFNFIGAMFYTQFFSQVDYIANWANPGKGLPQTLQIPILMILDEFANVGKVPNFEKILSYARSLNVGIFIIVQSLLQLKDMYKEAWEGLLDPCDVFLFLGGQSQFTLDYMSKKIGKETVDNTNRSRSFGRSGSASKSDQILARSLMTPDEIALLSEREALLFIRTFRPFKGLKYDIKAHKNYEHLSEDKDFYIHKVSGKDITIKYTYELSFDELFGDEFSEHIQTKEPGENSTSEETPQVEYVPSETEFEESSAEVQTVISNLELYKQNEEYIDKMLGDVDNVSEKELRKYSKHDF